MSKFLALNRSLEEISRLRMVSENTNSVTLIPAEDAVTYEDRKLSIGLIPAKAALPLATIEIDRFTPKYWYIDGPNTASFAITSYENGFEALFQCRVSSDLIGVVWDSENTLDHKHLAYETKQDYTGLVWDFDIALSPSMPALNDEDLPPTLTIHYLDALGRKGIAYVALKNYAIEPDSRETHITIDWSTVKGGADNKAEFSVKAITKIFFGCYTAGYDKANVSMYDEPVEGYLRVTNSVVTGTGTKLKLTKVVTKPHDVGMSTSYDDHYNLNPQRVVDNLVDLGYQGLLNHYCGMSHYPSMFWNKELGRFYIPDVTETPDVNVVNPATTRWHEAYASAAHAAGFTPVFSVSWELYSQAAREEWCQRDFNDNIGRTGYEPPSYFASLSNNHAIQYLRKVYKEIGDTMVAGGCAVKLQIGEPWHWFNVATLMPCVYDYETRLEFNADTGLYAPDLGTILEAVDKTDETSQAFKDWLRDKLGQTCRDYRTYIKEQFGDSAEVCPLIFFPSILTHEPSLATYINYPVEHYSYPNFDFIMTEAYDWVIEQPPRLDLSHNAVGEIPIDQLGYPPEKVAYLSGFVPDNQIAYIYKLDYTKNYRAPIWQRIFGDMKNNADSGILKQHVWAYPQVMQDSITVANDGFFFDTVYYPPITDNTPYPEEIFGEDLEPYTPPPVTKPKSIAVKRSSYGDLYFSWGVDNPVEGDTFEVQVMNASGVISLWSKRTADRFVTMLVSEAEELGLVEASIKVIIIPENGEASEIEDVAVETSDTFVTTALFVGGQSHAAAQFTSMSIDEDHPRQGADDIRKTYADITGVDPALIMPVLIGWGSSAIDKLGQSDGDVDGENYWYDLDAGTNGPRLTEALSIIDSHSSIPTKRLFWTQGSADADANAIGEPFNSTPSRYVDATKAVLDSLYAKMTQDQPIVWQLINRKYYGTVEIFGDSRREYRNAQLEMIRGNDQYVLGTWSSGAESPDGYILEQGFRAHNTAKIYHEVAMEVGVVLATGEDLSVHEPIWISYPSITNVDMTIENEDMVFTWDAAGYPSFEVHQINVLTGDTLYVRTTSTNTDTFTAEEQRAAYEYTASSAKVIVIGIGDDGIAGVPTTYTVSL